MAIQANIQSLDSGKLVKLLILDSTNIGGTIHYFSEAKGVNSQPVEFSGHTFVPMVFNVTGFEKTSKGTIPQPTLTIADISGSMLHELEAYGDLVGSKVTRIVTFEEYLGSNSSVKFPDEIYYIERKTNANKFMITFSLSSLFDMHGTLLPRRLVLKDVCTLVYRIWLPGSNSFFYKSSSIGCPYSTEGAGAYFTANGEPTIDPALDVCGKRYSDCVLRYPKPNALPTNMFPGVSKVRR